MTNSTRRPAPTTAMLAFWANVDMLNRSRVLATVDDTHGVYDRFIPGDRVAGGEEGDLYREVHAEHAFGVTHGVTRGACAHDTGEEGPDGRRICYTCGTWDW